MSTVDAETAAQAKMRREANANLGPWRNVLLALSKELPLHYSTMPVEGVLACLREKKDPRVITMLDTLKQELGDGVCDTNEEEAEKWKNKGMEAYKNGKLEESVLMFTRGMMYAKEDVTLEMLIYNRSTSFFAQQRILEALIDAHTVMIMRSNNWEALQQRGMCLKKLGFEEEGTKDMEAAANKDIESANGKEVLAKILQSDTLIDSNGKNIHDGSLLFIPGETNTSIPISIESISGVNEKGVVSKTRIESGEILRETPIAHALYDDHWGIRCCYCFRVTRVLYPGITYRKRGKISRGLFCSESCANTSWERYGQYETHNPFFQICPIDALLASRMLRMENKKNVDIHSLRGDFSGELQPAAVIGGFETVVSLIGLVLGALTPEEANRLRLTQRQVILSGLDVRFFTGSQITINTETGEAFMDDSKPILVGKGIYIMTSHFRHSCDPNCFLSFVGNPLDCSLSLTIRAIKSIGNGEELTIAYHNMTTYKAVSALTRQRALVERCGFICHCSACMDNKDERVSLEKKEYYIKAADLYQKGCRLIREGQYEVAATVLSQSYNIAMEHLCPPPRPPQSMIPKTHMALAKAFNHLKNNVKCAEHLEAKVEAEKTLYGENHVEFIDDFIRLAFFEPTEEKRRMYAEKGVELLQRFYAPSKEMNTVITRIQSFVVRKHC
ncbi:SET and MYND domain-containing protein [Trypanosoma theileri]|uniref:SET and MYND domain-containing protein n=1 Tax=Trypanosoma theileri TaxID=67003 RepID=A0A1X0P998_9TRYP|nr:SET and MYND domain-containing protein [Trypanosoma theileri]ORC93517.1 SET and MYND domain-containing protein [Trypanosoma theileri]